MVKTTIDVNTLDSSKGFVVQPGRTDEFFAAQAIGDVNGDGFADVAIASNRYLYNGNGDEDSIYVVFGGENVTSSGSVNVSKLNGQNGFEWKSSDPSFDIIDYDGVKALGDINGDGFADFVVQFDQKTNPNEQYGSTDDKSLLVFGDKNIGSSGTLDIKNIGAANAFSGDLEVIGDINGDGISEFKIVDDGVKYYLGSKDSVLDTSKSFKLVNSVFNGNANLRSTGDVNGDGFEDLLISDNYSRSFGGYSTTTLRNGAGYVVFGGADVADNGEVDVSNLNGNNGFSFKYGDGATLNSIIEVGDMNGDGLNETAILAQNADKAYVIYGKESGFNSQIDLRNLNASDGFTIDGANVSQFGWGDVDMSSAGDFNSDGIADLAISSSFAGNTYVVYGNQNIGGTINLDRLNGNNGVILENAGENVRLAGDVNGDGASDLLLQSQSSTYVVYGGGVNQTTPPTPGETFVGDKGKNNLVGTAGDDLIRGRGGNDTLDGKAGNDEIRGGGGRDIINGGAGNDIIAGGNGKDIMTGGAGADTFVYKDLANRKDRITDFEVGRDKIDISAILDDPNYSSSDQNFSEYIDIVSSGSDTRIKIDVLGDQGDDFKTLVVLKDVDHTQVNSDSFII